MQQLKIDSAFKNLIPPLSNDEFAQLEENILSQGQCREAIKIWRGIIIDGHNRYAICQKHGIKFHTQNLNFSNKKEAELWIIENQIGRRNLINAMRIKLVLHKESLLREQAKQNRSGVKGEPVNVRKILAKEAGVSEQTLQRYMKIRALGSSKLKAEVDSGEKTIGAAYKMLQVTSREVWYDKELTDITNSITARAVLRDIDRIEGLCKFLCGNSDIICSQEGVEAILKRVDRLLAKVQGISGRFIDADGNLVISAPNAESKRLGLLDPTHNCDFEARSL